MGKILQNNQQNVLELRDDIRMMAERQAQLEKRMAMLEYSVFSIRSDLDKLTLRLDRVESRLELTDSQVRRSKPMNEAPWSDFAGYAIREGDIIFHPSGEIGKVVFVPNKLIPEDQWLVDYGDGCLSRLCLQIGDKGQAKKMPVVSSDDPVVD